MNILIKTFPEGAEVRIRGRFGQITFPELSEKEQAQTAMEFLQAAVLLAGKGQVEAWLRAWR